MSPKWQRAEKLSEEHCKPKLMNRSCGQHNYKNAFHRLTPELSRPVAGRRTRASVAHSTWLTPRHGVGLNDLLGGKEAGEGDAPAHLPKDRSPDA